MANQVIRHKIAKYITRIFINYYQHHAIRLFSTPYRFTNMVHDIFKINILYTDSDLYKTVCFWDNKRKKPAIVLSRSNTPLESDFILVHTLAHLFLHWKWYIGKDLTKATKRTYGLLCACGSKNHQSNTEQERIANEFATYVIRHFCKSRKITLPLADYDTEKATNVVRPTNMWLIIYVLWLMI